MVDNTILLKIMNAQKVLTKLDKMGIKNLDDLDRIVTFYKVANSNGITNANVIPNLIASNKTLSEVGSNDLITLLNWKNTALTFEASGMDLKDLNSIKNLFDAAKEMGLNSVNDLTLAKNSLDAIQAEFVKNGITLADVSKISLMKIAYDSLSYNQISVAEIPELANAKQKLAGLGITNNDQLDQILSFLNEANALITVPDTSVTSKVTDVPVTDGTLIKDTIVSHVDEIIAS